MPRIDNFLQLMNERGASDLHFTAGRAPAFRLHGEIDPVRYKTLSQGDFDLFISEITPPELWERFKSKFDVDFAYECPGLARFRVNLFRQERGDGAVFRLIPSKLFTLEQLGMPDQVHRLSGLRKGLVLVTGPTGSGKSTTLAAIVHEMNLQRRLHIVTIEDPIEFVHENLQCVVNQREVGSHVPSFSAGISAALREDPDVILMGEMRDRETVQLALHAAETGLLVFGTLHTNTAAKAVDRIINVFPADEQAGVRGVVADVLTAVLAQQLLKRKGEKGRVAALEILFGSPAMSTMIRDNKTFQITNLIAQGKRQGMQTMDDTLIQLIKEDRITPEAAYEKAVDKKDFRTRVFNLCNVTIGTQDEGPPGQVPPKASLPEKPPGDRPISGGVTLGAKPAPPGAAAAGSPKAAPNPVVPRPGGPPVRS
jgi:twitching motility protein PilT